MSECREHFDSQYTSKSTATENVVTDGGKIVELEPETKKYGVSKPRRKYIRATIIHDIKRNKK